MTAKSSLSQDSLPVDPTANLQAATKQYVDNVLVAAQNFNVVPRVRLAAVSSDATTAAIVFTNLTTTFTPARVGAKYRLFMHLVWVADTVSTVGMWVYWKHNGTPTTADNQGGRTLMRSHADAGGVDHKTWSVDMVATALTPITATLGINLPNIGGSDLGPVRLHSVSSTGTNAAQFGSEYWVDRVTN